jgi:hypothetical protein
MYPSKRPPNTASPSTWGLRTFEGGPLAMGRRLARLERTEADALNLERTEGRCRTVTALAGQTLAAIEQGPLWCSRAEREMGYCLAAGAFELHMS